MIWIDNTTAILVDSSILNFSEDGSVQLFGGKKWKKKMSQYKFKYSTKENAIKIWEEVDNLIIKEYNEKRANNKSI